MHAGWPAGLAALLAVVTLGAQRSDPALRQAQGAPSPSRGGPRTPDPGKRAYATWSDYGGASDSMQYSSLTQITRTNVSQLEQAWFFPVPDKNGNFGFNPLVVDNVMYVLGPKNAIVALDAGEPIWSHVVEGGTPGNRGINYWESTDRSDRRLIFGAGTLREIDARTGQPIKTFGVEGRVDMRAGETRPLGGPTGTAGRVFENLFITGSTTGEGYGSPPGDLRAFDVITGKVVWTFHTIPHPGEFGYDTWPRDAWTWAGGSNWAGSAADPTTGMFYVRSADQPGFHRLREPGSGGNPNSGSPAQRGRAVFAQRCESCHGQPEFPGIRSMDRSIVINLRTLGNERIRTTIRSGQGQMPAFTETMISGAQLDALLVYLADPAAGAAGASGPPRPSLPAVEGIVRYTGPLGSMFRAANGLPAISPPWAEIVAYDLNEGTIKWRAPLGSVRSLVARGITDTGNATRVHRNGPVVTAGGLIFIGTNADGMVRAYDKDTGKVLWERQLDANPEGMAAVYEVGGREHVVFCTSHYDEVAPGNIAIVAGKAEAQGYYVFALPK